MNERAERVRPVRAMEALFVRQLPAWKRGLDIVGASLGLAVLAPLLAIVAIAVRFTSPVRPFSARSEAAWGARSSGC